MLVMPMLIVYYPNIVLTLEGYPRGSCKNSRLYTSNASTMGGRNIMDSEHMGRTVQIHQS